MNGRVFTAFSGEEARLMAMFTVNTGGVHWVEVNSVPPSKTADIVEIIRIYRERERVFTLVKRSLKKKGINTKASYPLVLGMVIPVV